LTTDALVVLIFLGLDFGAVLTALFFLQEYRAREEQRRPWRRRRQG